MLILGTMNRLRIALAKVRAWILSIPLKVALLSGAALALLGAALMISPVGTPVAAMAGDALADLTNRSPGERAGGIATKGKLAARAAPAAYAAGPGGPIPEPSQRALGKTFDGPVMGGPDFGPLLVGAPAEPFGVPDLSGLASDTVLVGGEPGGWYGGGWYPGGGYGYVPGGFVTVPGGGGGGGSGGCAGAGCGGGTTPPVPGIPEPQSWALLLLGFASIGAAMRVRARKVRLAH